MSPKPKKTTTAKRRKKPAKAQLVKLDKEPAGLCWRCEHRAKFNETKAWRPRSECGDTTFAANSCYMYRPVAPAALCVNAGDDRPPLDMPMIAARMHRIGVLNGARRVTAASIEQDGKRQDVFLPYISAEEPQNDD